MGDCLTLQLHVVLCEVTTVRAAEEGVLTGESRLLSFRADSTCYVGPHVVSALYH